MLTNEEILNAFRLTHQNKKELRLVNAFKGLPISFPAIVLSVENEKVTLRVDRSQVVCIYRDHDTYIQGEYFRETVKGYVTQLDLIKLEAVLSAYEVPQSSFNNRAQIRVEPDNPISGNIKTKDARIPFRGQLADISQGGVGIFIEERLYLPNVYHPGAEISININLPNMAKLAARTTVSYDLNREANFDAQGSRLNLFPESSKPSTSLTSTTYHLDPASDIELRGTVVKVVREPNFGRCRIGIRLLASDAARAVINHFITIRQNEIIAEIRAEYNTLVANLSKRR